MDLPRILRALQLMKPFEGDHDLQRAQAIPSASGGHGAKPRADGHTGQVVVF